MRATFNIPKDQIKAVFKVDKYIKVDDLEGFASAENLQAEIERATEKEEELQGNIDGVLSALDFEIQARENADTQLDEKIDGININLTRQIDDLEQDVNDKYNELVRDIDDLTDVVEDDYNTLDAKVNNSVQTINERITNVADEINQSIEDNVVSLQSEDNDLQNQINAHSQTLTNISEEIDTKISRVEAEHLISQIQQFKHEVVNSLPEEGSSSVMYLVPKLNAPNVYEEWIWLEDEQRYEDIGSTAIDLSEYAKLTDIPTNFATTTQLTSLSNQLSSFDKPTITKSNNNQNGIVKHTDGRMEQWGLATSSSTGETEFTMNNSFVDTNFQVFIEPRQAGDLVHYVIPSATNKFKARIQNTRGSFMTCQFQWRAYGFWK